MKEIAVVDIETTGMLNQGGLIVEIGIVGLNLETGKLSNKSLPNLTIGNIDNALESIISLLRIGAND